jgi:hypothetical protein
MGEVVYTSEVQVVRRRGPLREAQLPGCERTVTFGVHDEIAEHYGVSGDSFPPDATTLDYLVAAAAG